MVLTLLWRDLCHPNPAVPARLRRHLGAFRFPLLLLGCNDPSPRVRVALAEDQLMPGLSLADALYQELDILMEDQSVLLMLPQNQRDAPLQPTRIVAELLHTLILRDARAPQQAPAAFDWAFRSLSAGWHVSATQFLEQRHLRDQALVEVLDFPSNRAKMTLPSYLRLLDPEHRPAITDPSLGRRLARCTALGDWQDALWTSFETARCRGVVNIRQN